MRIGGVDIPVQTARAAPRARGGRFTLPEEDEAASQACGRSAPTAAVGAISVPSDWAGTDDAVADREARRHGRAMLDALAGLQLAQLGGDPKLSLAGLAKLAAATPLASDPRLRAVMEAVAARVAVELARRE